MSTNQVSIVLLIIVVSLTVFFLFSKNSLELDNSTNTNQKQDSLKKVTVTIRDKKVIAELADSPAKQSKGLMFRESMNENSGMLFVFNNSSIRSFWMANTKIELDMIWADENKKIVFIHNNVPPCTKTGNLQAYCTRYKPDMPAKYVLEVNGGWVKKNNIKLGDILQITN